MPTRKQRRRRQKERRHEWEYVYVDDEGHEVAVDEAEPAGDKTARRPAKADAKPGSRSRQPAGRGVRKVDPPSWQRSVRRAVPWQILMVVVVVFLLRSSPLATRLSLAVIYGVAFIPFTYWIDKMAYRRYLRASGQVPSSGKPERKG